MMIPCLSSHCLVLLIDNCSNYEIFLLSQHPLSPCCTVFVVIVTTLSSSLSLVLLAHLHDDTGIV